MTTEPSLFRARWLTRAYRWLGFSRVIAPALPREPAIVLAAHYNGLLDGFVYSALSPRMLGVLSAQWHRHALGRFLLPALAVTRAKDREAGAGDGNLAAFKGMLTILTRGRSLLYFPEGTSRLGPERLPIQRGVELLLRRARKETPDIPVYFAAAHYEHPTRWRSRVQLAWDGPHALPAQREGLAEWVAAGLLRAQESALAQPWPQRSNGIATLRRTLGALLLLPILPARFAAAWAIRRKADERNVISLWRLLGGIPATVVCWLAWAAIATGLGESRWLWLVPVMTLLGVAAWTR